MHLALMRFTGNVFSRPQGLQRWELLGLGSGPQPLALGQPFLRKSLFTNQDSRATAMSWGAASVSLRVIISPKSAPAAITKYHWLSGLYTEMYFLTILEARGPRSRCWKFGFLGRSLFLACRWSPFCCSLTWPFFWWYMGRERKPYCLFLFL